MRIPENVASKLRKEVFGRADDVGYLLLSRQDSKAFIDELVAAPGIGQKIADFTGKEKVRTYIKDAILNKYSKDKAREARPADLAPVVKRQFGFGVTLVDAAEDVFLYKSCDGKSAHYVVAVNGSYIKWETALKKALLYLPGKPFAGEKEATVGLLLTLFCGGTKRNHADKEHLKKALDVCKAKVYFYGESIDGG